MKNSELHNKTINKKQTKHLLDNFLKKQANVQCSYGKESWAPGPAYLSFPVGGLGSSLQYYLSLQPG